MWKTIAIYALMLAVAAFVLDWLEYRHVMRVFSTEIYIVAIAVGFTGLGAWVGHRLTRKQPTEPFEKNEAALRSLRITEREYAVLEQLAAGHANKEIARSLGVSPNTVKTHLARLYEKLDVQRRTQAVRHAKSLGLIP